MEGYVHRHIESGRAKDPKKDLHASLDALMTVFKGHQPVQSWEPGENVRVGDIAANVVERLTMAIVGQPLTLVISFAKVLCHLSAWSGPRILRCWKVMMLHFYAGRRTKYAFK